MNRHAEKSPARRRIRASREAQRVLAQAVKTAANYRPLPSPFGDSENMAVRVACVFGPYRNRDKWRVIYDEGDRRLSRVFATYEEAQAVVETMRASRSSQAKRAIGDAVAEFLAEKQKQGLRPLSLRSWADRLRHLDPSASLASIQPRDAQALYDRWVGTFAAASHRAYLRFMRAFFAWCVERGYLRANPFAGIKPVGQPKRGKPQLRVDEARILLSELMDAAERGEEQALGLALQMLHGLRSGEVLKLRARDIDGNGTRLCVAMEGGKTANATRTLQVVVPALQTLLMRQKAGRRACDLLFGHGRARPGDYLWDYLNRCCARLNLPRVCPHSLRGMHATFAVQDGASAQHVAAVLGHGSSEITRRHYIAPGTEREAQARSVAALLLEHSPPHHVQQSAENRGIEQAIAVLRALSPAERAVLLDSVDKRQ